MGYKVTLQSKIYGKEIMFRKTIDEALDAVKSIFETIRNENLNDAGANHRKVIVETAFLDYVISE